MDPILLVMTIQTAVFTATLIVLIFQVRAQVHAIRADLYARCQADYSSLIRMLVQQGELQTVYDDLAKLYPNNWNWTKYDTRQKVLYNYIELNYELFERVFFLWKNRWIDEETWNNWEVWLDELCDHPIFLDVARDNKGMFGTEFEEYVGNKIQKKSDRRRGTSINL